ncbi:MAG: hypothetical protein LUC18_04005, partial [Porphyromonadaceae bacterium]|nr:hypothetical protein [Porphyromonadaceae bacterium]
LLHGVSGWGAILVAVSAHHVRPMKSGTGSPRFLAEGVGGEELHYEVFCMSAKKKNSVTKLDTMHTEFKKKNEILSDYVIDMVGAIDVDDDLTMMGSLRNTPRDVFYADLFQFCEDVNAKTGHIDRFDPDKDKIMTVFGEKSYKALPIETALELSEGKDNAYCCSVTFYDNYKRDQYIEWVFAFVVDVDNVKPSYLNVILKNLVNISMMPTYIVNSGRGLHLYYVLKEPLRLYPEIRPRAMELHKELNKAMTPFFTPDVHSLGQAYRIVGSNTKIGEVATSFKVGPKYDVVDIANFCEYPWHDRSRATDKMVSFSEAIIKTLGLHIRPNYNDSHATFDFIAAHKDEYYLVKTAHSIVSTLHINKKDLPDFDDFQKLAEFNDTHEYAYRIISCAKKIVAALMIDDYPDFQDLDVAQKFIDDHIIPYAKHIATMLNIDDPAIIDIETANAFVSANESAYTAKTKKKSRGKGWYDAIYHRVLEDTPIGHRYSSLRALCVAAMKAHIPEEKLDRDLDNIKAFWQVKPEYQAVEFTWEWFDDAKRNYNEKYIYTSNARLYEWLDWTYTPQPRKSRHTQEEHLKIVHYDRRNRSVNALVDAIEKDPEAVGNKALLSRMTGLSRPTVAKYLVEAKHRANL